MGIIQLFVGGLRDSDGGSNVADVTEFKVRLWGYPLLCVTCCVTPGKWTSQGLDALLVTWEQRNLADVF